MNKWLKISISVSLTVLIIAMGLINFDTMMRYGVTSIIFWLAAWGFSYFLIFPAFNRWWKFWNRILWDIQPETYSKSEVSALFKEFIVEVGENKIKTYDEFEDWLKKKDLK